MPRPPSPRSRPPTFGRTKRERDAGLDHPQLSDRRNIVVIVDEAHRSHYDHLDGYARHLDALPRATLIAFTGTPLSFADRDTQEVFGDSSTSTTCPARSTTAPRCRSASSPGSPRISWRTGRPAARRCDRSIEGPGKALIVCGTARSARACTRRSSRSARSAALRRAASRKVKVVYSGDATDTGLIRQHVRTDWTVRVFPPKLRSSIKRLLVRHGYPPDQQPAAIKLVIEQMEQLAPPLRRPQRIGPAVDGPESGRRQRPPAPGGESYARVKWRVRLLWSAKPASTAGTASGLPGGSRSVPGPVGAAAGNGRASSRRRP